MSKALQRLATAKRMQRLAQERRDLARQQAQALEAPPDLEAIFTGGGQDFLEIVAAKGVDRRGDPIRLNNWYREYLEFVGDFRIAHKYASGCAQVGKSFAFYLLALVAHTEWNLDIIWAWDKEAAKDKNVKAHWKPLRKKWLQSIRKEPFREDSDDLSFVQWHQKCHIEFTFVSTSTDAGDGLAGVGSRVTSTTHDMAVKDERSQAPQSCWEPIANRLEQSRIPTRPEAEIGTPGSGAGIEAAIEACDREFIPYCHCPHCFQPASLHPEACLLKPISTGEEQRYLSATGRPLQWFHSNPADPTNSAYFGCEHCGGILDQPARDNAYFRDKRTKQRLTDYLRELPPGKPDRPQSIAVQLYCSLLRGEDKASEIITKGIGSTFPANWVQQDVGMPAKYASGGITSDMIRRAYSKELETTGETIVIAGGDQGRSDFWLWVMRVYLPANRHGKPLEQTIEHCQRELLFADGITIDRLPEMIATYGIQAGFIDNEPDRAALASQCRNTPFELADQRSQNQQPKATITQESVSANGLWIPCYKINARLFCTQLYNAFALYQYKVPSWEHISQRSDRSPKRHLMAPQRNPENGWWVRPKDHIDDLFFAGMFAEAALYQYLSQQPWTTSGVRR